MTRTPARAVIATIAIAVVVAGCSGGAAPSRGALTNETPVPKPTATARPAFAGTVLKVAGTPIDVASAGGSLWVSDIHGDAVVRLDRTATRASGSVKLGTGQGPAYMVALGNNLFVSNNNGLGVSRIDAATGTATGVVAGDQQTCCNPVAAAGAVWIPGEKGLLRIDPATLKVTATIAVGDRPDGVATDGTHIWGTNDTNIVWVVDTATNKVANLTVAGFPLGFADGSLWVGHGNDVLRVDSTSGSVTATIPIGHSYSSAVVSDLAAYVVQDSTLAGDSSVIKLNLAANAVVGQPVALPGLAPSGIRLIDGVIWLPSFDDGTVIRLPVW